MRRILSAKEYLKLLQGLSADELSEAAKAVVGAEPLLKLMDSPDNVRGLAALYVRIYFAGMPFNMAYNFAAAVLRAVGDTRRPMYILVFSGLINVLFNLFFYDE